MDKLTIPIPDGIDEAQKADLTGWFTELAQQVTAPAAVLDDDPAVRAEVVRRVKQGMVEIAAGDFCDSDEFRRQLDVQSAG